MSIASKVAGLLMYRRLFVGTKDLLAFRRLRHRQSKSPATPVALRLKALDGALQFCRPGTTDAAVLIETFIKRYHLPPTPLGRNAVILDLGANVGYTMADFACRFPQSRVIGYELDAGNAALAALNTKPFGSRCQVNCGAIWHKTGKITYGGDQEWGFRVTADVDDSLGNRKTAPAHTMHDVLDMHELDYVDYIKMDIEGAEAHVLRDNSSWLNSIGSIKIEVHAPATMAQCIRDLTDAGFTCSPDIVHPSCVVGVRHFK
jgi:FkbM family methyltransferase